jgi:hypothetical protein
MGITQDTSASNAETDIRKMPQDQTTMAAEEAEKVTDGPGKLPMIFMKMIIINFVLTQ